MPMNSHSVSNPYVAEARARVRDRARGITKGGSYGPEQTNNDGYVAQYEPAAAYSIGHGNDNAGLGNGTQRNDSWGGQYAP
ncbi:uncharacterized protein FOMMEDRAFT_143101 [Fomitiporia mediterranea MF3/22]|uniref:uncharacterized protein n=1 Tax=Fomitiporia mediterranea (strain MF3/22) TaxID=694068 RepID=UPI000440763A|nr:uncharacterized protein FOMMEDRAFT_143101 [Fomitiporia mediterranea MF3/22]EJC98696.1 hypothetical protein FOMMEDRAFT_143101 [Fomitiporia mediterranea MF3/22]